jgi:hypothetical protein
MTGREYFWKKGSPLRATWAAHGSRIVEAVSEGTDGQVGVRGGAG